MIDRRVIIVGGGISGLTAAFWLHRAGADVTVYEQQDVPGGTMRTEYDHGWLVETGPNSALETTPLLNEMFDKLGILPERAYADPSSDKRFILRNGQLHVLPMTPPAFLRSKLWTLRGKLRLLKEPFVGRAEREESIAEFVERRLGREFLDYAINPFVAGVYAGSPEQLSVRSAFPKLYALEEKYGGLIRGMIGGARERKKRAEKAKDRARMFSFLHGMQTFPEAIARDLGIRFKPGFAAVSIARVGNEGLQPKYQVTLKGPDGEHTEIADHVILAVPASVASDLVLPLSSELSAELNRVYYPPVAEVSLGYRAEQISRSLDGFGYLIPAKEQRKILGTIWSSSLFPGRAPEGHVALTTFVGGSRQPDLLKRTDSELLAMVTEEIRSILGASGDPVFARIHRWEKAIPQYNMGYARIIDAIEKFENTLTGLHICANYRGGIAVGDCVMNGKKTADRILSLMASSDTAVAAEPKLG